MKKKFILFIIIPLLVNSVFAAAQFVWRADYRGPAEIFRDGFRARGANPDLVSHIMGITNYGNVPQVLATNFISTAGTYQQVAHYITAQQAMYPENPETDDPGMFWIYTIRADNRFFNAESTLTHFLPLLLSNNESNDMYDTIIAAQVADEWVARGSIPTENIYFASPFTFDSQGNLRPIVGRAIHNPRYEPRDTQGNSGVLPESTVQHHQRHSPSSSDYEYSDDEMHEIIPEGNTAGNNLTDSMNHFLNQSCHFRDDQGYHMKRSLRMNCIENYKQINM